MRVHYYGGDGTQGIQLRSRSKHLIGEVYIVHSYISWLGVRSDLRKSGWASALLTLAESHLRSEGKHIATLNCAIHNLDFYRKRGWEIEYIGGELPSLCYHLYKNLW